MKRLLWLGAGLAIGALAVRVVTKKAQSYTPRGVAAAARDSGRNLVDSVRGFVDDVRDGMHEREQELRAAFLDGVDLADEFDNELDNGLDDGLDNDKRSAELGGGPAGPEPPARTPPEDGTG